MNDKICIHLICRNLKQTCPTQGEAQMFGETELASGYSRQETTKWYVEKEQPQILKNMAAAKYSFSSDLSS